MLATLPTIWPAAAVEVFPAALTQRYAWPEPKIKKKYMAALRYAEQPTASLLAGLLIACLQLAGTLSPSRAANGVAVGRWQAGTPGQAAADGEHA